MSKLEDLLVKEKATVPILDLSKSVVQTSEEFKRLMEKVPEFKMRPIKVRPEEIKIREKDYSFKMSKKEQRKLIKKGGEVDPIYTYGDPIPVEMRSVVLDDLYVVPIDWKMLTSQRPKLKMEEDYFSRLVEMGKLQLKTRARDRKEALLNPHIKKIKNKSGIIETRIQTCSECGEEMCNGKSCSEFSYEMFARVEPKIVKPRPQPKPQTFKIKTGARKTPGTTGNKSKKSVKK